MKKPDPEEFVDQQDIEEFTSILTDFYRGEIQRAYTWRTRLDRTTNWAILILSGLITWTFSVSTRPDELLLFSILFLSILLIIEARRYRFYNVWASRIRVLEENFIAKALNPEEEVSSREWMKTLADDLKDPHFKIQIWVAISHRLRRVYIWLYTVVIILWLGKVAMHPYPSSEFEVWLNRAGIGSIPGIIIILSVLGFYFFTIVLALIGPKVEERKSKIKTDKSTRKEWEKKM
ncbi:MAG: DUF2270 domain-containing protein [Candidatus Thermoplasmatota archaeon]|nr:DUF2270 domain-containing protein [Candidatus Thermoplasmatota archaeon]